MSTLANIELAASAARKTNVVTTRRLANGGDYQLQNLGSQPIRLAESAAAPNGNGYWLLPAYGDTVEVTINTALPLWAWIADTDGGSSVLGITPTS